jgi:hypothetical protein
MSEIAVRDWTIVLVLTALCLSIVVLGQILTTSTSAYLAAPQEVNAFFDTIENSILENESYDLAVGKVVVLEDKIRLSRLLREIQRSGDDLREELNRLLEDDFDRNGTPVLRTSSRLLWASKKKTLEDRVRRLDQLRMRFLVLYMGVITTMSAKTVASPPKDPEKSAVLHGTDENGSPRRALAKALTEGITKQPLLRRLTTQAVGHNNDNAGVHKQNWFGVVQELQKSPKLQQRHASIETAMSRTPSASSTSPSTVRLQRIAPTSDTPKADAT